MVLNYFSFLFSFFFFLLLLILLFLATKDWALLKHGPHGGFHGHYDKLELCFDHALVTLLEDYGTVEYSQPLHYNYFKRYANKAKKKKNKKRTKVYTFLFLFIDLLLIIRYWLMAYHNLKPVATGCSLAPLFRTSSLCLPTPPSSTQVSTPSASLLFLFLYLSSFFLLFFFFFSCYLVLFFRSASSGAEDSGVIS